MQAVIKFYSPILHVLSFADPAFFVLIGWNHRDVSRLNITCKTRNISHIFAGESRCIFSSLPDHGTSLKEFLGIFIGWHHSESMAHFE